MPGSARSPRSPTSGTKRQGTRADHGGPLRAAHDELELLAVAAADGDDQSAAGLELLVERARHLRRRGRDGDRGERRVLGQSERAVADVDVDALVAGGGERRARASRPAPAAARSCAPRPPARRAPRPGTRSPCRRRARARRRAAPAPRRCGRPCTAGRSSGPRAIGSAASSYARSRYCSGTKSSRGTRSIAASTRSSADVAAAKLARPTIRRRAAASSSDDTGGDREPGERRPGRSR